MWPASSVQTPPSHARLRPGQIAIAAAILAKLTHTAIRLPWLRTIHKQLRSIKTTAAAYRFLDLRSFGRNRCLDARSRSSSIVTLTFA